jgi:purine catabolism regulator
MALQKPSAPVHPHVTVEDVWRAALPQGTELVGGETGLRREVVWCTALRARSPAFMPLRGGELLLVDRRVLAAVDSKLTLARLLESLSGQNVAGAAATGRVGADARRIANEKSLPLFALPAETALDQVEQAVLRHIVDRRAELHERAQDLHRQLSELALAGRGLPSLLSRLRELTGMPVLLEREGGLDYVDPAGQLPESLAAAIAAQRPSLEDWLREVPLSAFDPPVALRSLGAGQARLVAPILVQGGIAGFLSLLGAEGELGEPHRLAVGRGAHACAIELVRARAARDARDEVEDEVLDVLAAGHPGSQRAASERARRRGFDIESPYIVMAASTGAESDARKLRLGLERQLGIMRIPALVRDRGATTLALVSLAGRKGEVKSLVDQLHRSLRGAAGGEVALGYTGARSGGAGVPGAAREAEQALTMGARLFGRDSATAFGDLGLYRLLYALQPFPELAAFREDVLGRLASKDRGGALLKTLAAYLATNGSPTDAADRLHLHRNTVLYRLGRIEELLQADLRDAETRLALHLALKIADVLGEQ